MMTGISESDIDSFIHEQKAKLLKERRDLTDQPSFRSPSSSREPVSLTASEVRKRQLQQERQREYNDILIKQQSSGRGKRRPRSPQEETPLQLGAYEQKRQELQKRRQEEYNNMLKKNGVSQLNNMSPAKGGLKSGHAASSNGLFTNMGQYENHRKALGEERKQEYNRAQAEKAARYTTPRRVADGPYNATLTALIDKSEQEQTQHVHQKERNEEYNEFLRDNEKRQRLSISPERKLSPKVGVGVNDSPERIRQGWSTPTYEEILEKRRQDESRYRRYDDPEYVRPGMKPYASEGALHRLESDRRLEDMRDQEARRLRFSRDEQGKGRSILDNADWLKEIQPLEDDFSSSLSRIRQSMMRGSHDDSALIDLMRTREGLPPRNPAHTSRVKWNDELDDHVVQGRVQSAPKHVPQAQQSPPATRNTYQASILVERGFGPQESSSARRRKQDIYRQELEQQIKEKDTAKKWEKQQNINVELSSVSNSEKPKLRESPSPRNHPPPQGVLDISSKSPFSSALSDQRLQLPDVSLDRGTGHLDRGGILESGWGSGGLHDAPPLSSRTLPPELTYQPSAYVSSQLNNSSYSAIDEAYRYYGLKNPLDPEDNGPGHGVPATLVTSSDTPRVTFDSNSRKTPVESPRTAAYEFGSNDSGQQNKSRTAQHRYQQELQKQIEEQKMKKQLAKVEQDRYEQKLDDEVRKYNPFGRGGGGAPVKDSQGNAIADLRHLRGPNAGPSLISSGPPEVERPGFVDAKPQVEDPYSNTGDAVDDASHARGGHGIFGVPKSEAEKVVIDRYKDELRKQIEEKRAREVEERAKLKAEEAEELVRINEQQIKIQQEFEEEKNKARQKEEENRLRNEEIKHLAEERKKDADSERQQAQDRRDQEIREQQESEAEEKRQQQENIVSPRGSSPPIPAIKSKLATQQNTNKVDKRGPSPPIPSLRRKPDEPSPEVGRVRSGRERRPTSRAGSADVLNQLAAMKRQLFTEKQRVENALNLQKSLESDKVFVLGSKKLWPDVTLPEHGDIRKVLCTYRKDGPLFNPWRTDNEDYTVYDARLDTRPPLAPSRREPEVDVFESARHRAPASVRRNQPPDNASPNTLQEFVDLKNRVYSESRQDLRANFPDYPLSNDGLEEQQRALIQRQEASLRELKGTNAVSETELQNLKFNVDGTYEREVGQLRPRDLGLRHGQPASPIQPALHTDTAFIDMNGVGQFPEDFEDLPRKQDSARQRRRDDSARQHRYDRQEPTPRFDREQDPFGSVASLDVDAIARRNETRLKKLHGGTTGDEVSLADPDDILDRFMSRQRHYRPPSGQTLQDDTWLHAGPSTRS